MFRSKHPALAVITVHQRSCVGSKMVLFPLLGSTGTPFQKQPRTSSKASSICFGRIIPVKRPSHIRFFPPKHEDVPRRHLTLVSNTVQFVTSVKDSTILCWCVHTTCTVSVPSGLAYRTQVLVLAAECGFESRPWHLCPWARHLTIIASLHPGVKWVPVRAELVD